MTSRDVPGALIRFRFAAGPAILLLLSFVGDRASPACLLLLAAGVLSDIFDGIIARRLQCSTPELRKLDSKADLVFWISTTAGTLIFRPELIPTLVPLAAVLAALEVVPPLISVRRFGQEASTHHVLSKAFGLCLWLLMTVLIAVGKVPWLIWSVFAVGVASELEASAIMLTLPDWGADVPSLRHAMRLRAAARANARAQCTLTPPVASGSAGRPA